MFYRNRLPVKPMQTVKLKLAHFKNGINTKTEENLLPINFARLTYNFSFKSGALTNGLGIETAKFTQEINLSDNSGIERLWLFKRYSAANNRNEYVLLIFTKSKKLYWSWLFNPTGNVGQLNTAFTACPQAINYRLANTDVMILTPPEAGNAMHTWDGLNAPQPVLNCPFITSLCIHNERLFATVGGDRKTLWFSTELDPVNWTVGAQGAGYITMADERGGLNKVFSFNGYVYVLRDYGISRVSAWGAQADFSVNHLFVSSGKIYANTAVLCGNRIVWLAYDGLYTFDGISTNKRTLGFEKLFEGTQNDNAGAEYHNGKYYLSCRLNYGDDKVVGGESDAGHKNNALIEYDLNTGEYCIFRGTDIAGLLSVQDGSFNKLLCWFNTGRTSTIGEVNNSGMLFNEPAVKVWSSPLTDLGYPDKNKVLKEIVFQSSHDCKLAVTHDDKTTEYEIKGSGKGVRVKLNLAAKKFSLEFSSDTQECNISNPQATILLV
ncbi:MAG: hypothetical protein FWE53_02890 [Firmicutes bacterium]|nr:hypothetical protein [Bacillota bacterium]